MPRMGEYLPQKISPDESQKLAAVMFREHVGYEPAQVVTKSCSIPIAAEHSHYFPSFGVLMRVNGVVSAAVQRGETTSGRVVSRGLDDARVRKLVEAIQNRLPQFATLDVSLVFDGCSGGVASTLSTAAVAILEVLGGFSEQQIAQWAGASVKEVLKEPYGSADALAAQSTGDISLVDVHAMTVTPLNRTPAIGFAMLELGQKYTTERSLLWERAAIMERCTELFETRGWDTAASLQSVSPEEWAKFLAQIDPASQSVVRYMIGENRRISRMVSAIKREDSQVLGALLLMSHSSRIKDLGENDPLHSFVKEQVEEAEGIHGARPTAAGDRILIVGRPYLLSSFLKRLTQEVSDRFGTSAISRII